MHACIYTPGGGAAGGAVLGADVPGPFPTAGHGVRLGAGCRRRLALAAGGARQQRRTLGAGLGQRHLNRPACTAHMVSTLEQGWIQLQRRRCKAAGMVLKSSDWKRLCMSPTSAGRQALQAASIAGDACNGQHRAAAAALTCTQGRGGRRDHARARVGLDQGRWRTGSAVRSEIERRPLGCQGLHTSASNALRQLWIWHSHHRSPGQSQA